MEVNAQQYIAHASLKAAIADDLKAGVSPESYADRFVRRYGAKGLKIPFADVDLRDCILAIVREIQSAYPDATETHRQ